MKVIQKLKVFNLRYQKVFKIIENIKKACIYPTKLTLAFFMDWRVMSGVKWLFKRLRGLRDYLPDGLEPVLLQVPGASGIWL